MFLYFCPPAPPTALLLPPHALPERVASLCVCTVKRSTVALACRQTTKANLASRPDEPSSQ